MYYNQDGLAFAVSSCVVCFLQACISPNRFLVQREIHDEFVEELAKRVASLRVGDGFDSGIDQGPLINAKAVSKVRELYFVHKIYLSEHVLYMFF